ncbi:MAG TPA: topoisomerase C-terminal repeat-containing protein, partial [Tenuifilaceae bacterium]|nr:topoisomerase C-terminal repeat-containing protein [Tenuifilaceae bacterium]
VSLKKHDIPLSITLERAIELIEEGRQKDKNKTIKVFEEQPDLQILNGRWGPYVKFNKENYKIPKGTDPSMLSYDECLKLIAEQSSAEGGKVKKGSKRKSKR